jgi:hypothetical protein
MELGFDTIGNATIICYDQRPMLVTDPWIVGDAYFGSWALSHAIPDEQLDAIRACPYVWFSHGHPDHLHPASLPLFRNKHILLPDHEGARIYQDLRRSGYQVSILNDQAWLALSDRIRIRCMSDYNQDAVLLIALDDCLLVNVNDAWELRGWGATVQRTVAAYPRSFLLALSGFGDANMINFYDEAGTFIQPPAARRAPVGQQISQRMAYFGTRFFIPFSSMHRYQRRDSVWANQYVTTLRDYAIGFDCPSGELLPAFVRFDCLSDTVTNLDPPAMPPRIVAPEAYGDDWDEPLERDEVRRLKAYFHAMGYLPHVIDFITFRVGNVETMVEFRSKSCQRGVTFEVPRQSLITAIDTEIFDDLLIGNFMKTTLHGSWEQTLSRGFTPIVAKYADNGRAKSLMALQHYLATYARRMVALGASGAPDPAFAALRADVTRRVDGR